MDGRGTFPIRWCQVSSSYCVHFQFDVVVSKAARLAPTLGVGRQRPLNLDIVFRQFFREGLRFAFSTNEGEIPLGSRLPFLSLLSK